VDAEKDVEAQQHVQTDISSPKGTPAIHDIKLSLKDVNPVVPVIMVLRRYNNLAILLSSGIFFAFGYSVTYTCSRILDEDYGYNPLQIGLVLLSYGCGSMLGSDLGGRYSDRTLKHLIATNGGFRTPELRLQTTWLTRGFMLLLPPSVAAYGWVAQLHLHIAAICVFLFLSGFFCIFLYASTLTYIVDANLGRSSTAFATNGAFRGLFAFTAAEVVIPIQGAVGEGVLYSIWAGLIVLAELMMVLVWWRGEKWRLDAEQRESESD